MKQNGFVLFVSLIFLLILTILGIAMIRGFTQDERMSGNYNEKSRALDAAQSALNTAKYWLGQPGNTYTGDWVTGASCTGIMSSASVCSNALGSPTTVPWTTGVSFAPSGMSTTVGTGNYYANNTNYYIQYLGTTSTNPPSAMYKVTATAAGGNATAVAVVESVFQVQALSRDIGGG